MIEPNSTPAPGQGDGPSVAAPPPPKPASAETHEVMEVAFKSRRREYYANSKEIPLRSGDWVIVQAERGEDLGRVHHTHEWVKRDHLPGNLRSVLRTARAEDLERLEQNRSKESRALQTCKERVEHRDVEMKVVDCEYQFDGNRITFFFTAEKRVDFRDLVKDLASIFRTRIELRQIGVRDESGRIGGMGTCGRELCCATWLRDFEPITLKMAKDQGLSPSPSKISGACGRLKCCLRYELDFYKEAAREFPKIGSRIDLDGVEWEVGRVDIFHRVLRLLDEGGKEREIVLEEIPPGTKLVGPSRDRRKGCDKEGCGSRGARPGDGSTRPAGDRPPGGRSERPGGGERRDRVDRGDRGARPGGERRSGAVERPDARPPRPDRDAGPPRAESGAEGRPPGAITRRPLPGDGPERADRPAGATQGRGERRRRRGRRDRRGGGGGGGAGGSGGGATGGGPAPGGAPPSGSTSGGPDSGGPNP